MTPRVQATRMARVVDRLGVVGQQLAVAYGLDGTGLLATHRDPGLQLLFRLEALATVVEAVPLAPLAATAAVETPVLDSNTRRRK